MILRRWSRAAFLAYFKAPDLVVTVTRTTTELDIAGEHSAIAQRRFEEFQGLSLDGIQASGLAYSSDPGGQAD